MNQESNLKNEHSKLNTQITEMGEDAPKELINKRNQVLKQIKGNLDKRAKQISYVGDSMEIRDKIKFAKDIETLDKINEELNQLTSSEAVPDEGEPMQEQREEGNLYTKDHPYYDPDKENGGIK